MILYDYVLSASCYKVRLMASLLGQDLTLHAVNFHPAREHKSPQRLALNPAGTLPVLRDGDLLLADSVDILKHLTRGAPNWQVKEGRWLEFASDLNASLGMARLHDILNYDVDIARARADGVRQLRTLEAHLTEQRFDGHRKPPCCEASYESQQNRHGNPLRSSDCPVMESRRH